MIMTVLKQMGSIFGIYITLNSTKISNISIMRSIYQMNVKFIFCVGKCSIILKFPNML